MAQNWDILVRRLHSDIISERMSMMKKLILIELALLTTNQRTLLTHVCSLFASVYDKAYTHDHFDTLLYQDKVRKIVAVGSYWQNSDYDKITEHNSPENKVARELVKEMSSHVIVDGLYKDISTRQAEIGIDYLELDKFRTLLIEILSE